MPKRGNNASDEVLPEYDFSKAEQGKFHKRYQTMKLKILLDPDVARMYPDSHTVNEALRAHNRIKALLQESERPAAASKKASSRRKAG